MPPGESDTMILHSGTQERYIAEITTGAGSTSKEGSTSTDSILVSLWVDSVTSGTLDITVYTLTSEGKEAEIITFPQIDSSTTSLLLRKAALSFQRFRIVATYTGVCEYEIYVRSITGGGEVSTRILGSTAWSTDKVIIGTSPVLLIASSLSDRTGIIIKNWSTTADVQVSESLAKLASDKGYMLAPRDNMTLDIAAGAEVYAVSTQANTDIRLGEIGGT